MILSTSISKKITSYNIKKYSKEYSNIDVGDLLNISVSSLPNGSHQKILVSCDVCSVEKEIFYFSYNKIFKKHNKYICDKCSIITREKNCMEKYGVKFVLQHEETREKCKNTMNIKYGVDYPAQNKEILKKIQNTSLNRYDTLYPNQNREIREKIHNTNLERYGNISSFGNKETKEKCKNTMNIRYGVDYTFQNTDLLKLSLKKTKKTKIKNIIKNNDEIISVNYDRMEYECYCEKCKNIYFVDTHLFNYRKKVYKTNVCIYCNKIGKQYSDLEKNLFNFIKENYNGEIIINNRKIIKPYELDIYLPELNLAFEFNGLYWHNELNKPNNYHKIKSDMCNDKGIQLIHIYEDDWNYKQDIIKSMILNKLGKTPNKIFGRKTEVKEIFDNKSVKDFLEKNHLQGFVGSKIKIGLFFENELISLMTFGKLRKSMNSKSKNENDYEMLRFCNKLNINVIGGASKLFKYFIKNYEFNEITSYADRSHSNGNLYKQLGFKLIHITSPNYYYIIDNSKHYRFNFRKNILIKQGFDPNKSEHEIMSERKIFRIYNSGNYKFIFEYVD